MRAVLCRNGKWYILEAPCMECLTRHMMTVAPYAIAPILEEELPLEIHNQ
jgi:hypothetical protein